jgi:predicted nucleic acid-binding protein
VNVAEVTRRAHLQERILWRDVWRVLSVWPVTLADGEDAGDRIYDLDRHGFQVPLPDALIAAVARRVGATVVTDNVRDFERLDIPVLRPY